jgi:iron complex outermembrane receptor protein
MIEVGTRSRASLALVLICVGLFPDPLDGAEPTTYRLHIASQPLDGALQEFARQSGIQVLFFSYLTDGLRAPALDGTYTADVAISALLAHSTLTFRWVNAKTIQITPLRRGSDRAQ